MKIEVFEACCSNLYNLVERAIAESSAKSDLVKVNDAAEAVKHGIMRTPALVINGKVVCAGRVPKYEEITGWLTGGAKNNEAL